MMSARLRYTLCIVLLCSLTVFVSAADTTNATITAQRISGLFEKSLPYTADLTKAQINQTGLEWTDLKNKGSYKILIKSSKYDKATGLLTMNINGWRNTGKGSVPIKVNNPVHFFLPWGDDEKSVTAEQQKVDFTGVLIRLLDTLPNGEPVNDDTWVIYPEVSLGGGGRAAKTSQNVTFSTIIGGTGSAVAYSSGDFYATGLIARPDPLTGYYASAYKVVLRVNTSVIPDTDSITSATVHYYGADAAATQNDFGNYNIDIVPADIGTALDTSDYDLDNYDIGTVLASIAWANWTVGSYNNFSITNFTNIDKTGYTTFGMLDSWTRLSTFGGTWVGGGQTTTVVRLQGYAGTTYDPFVTIISAPSGDTTPPDSLTGFGNTTTCSQTNISWTNPGDADFNHTYSMWQNIWVGNLTNSTTWYNRSGLSASTLYTFSSRTCDLLGNCNTTWHNHSVTTPACPDTTPPDSITNLENVTTCNIIAWSWTNPLDPDYAGVQIWMNEGSPENISAPVSTKSWLNLSANLSFTFGSRTYDLTGNFNETWVNQTATTQAFNCSFGGGGTTTIINGTAGSRVIDENEYNLLLLESALTIAAVGVMLLVAMFFKMRRKTYH